MEKFLLISAAIPWAFLLLPVHEHYNWQYKFKIAKRVRVAMYAALVYQVLSFVVFVISKSK